MKLQHLPIRPTWLLGGAAGVASVAALAIAQNQDIEIQAEETTVVEAPAPGPQPAPQAPQVQAPAGWLGAWLIDPPAAAAHQLPDGVGAVMVENIFVDSPAAVALQRFDLITHINGQPAPSATDLPRFASQLPAGVEVVFDLLRNGQPLRIAVVLVERPADLSTRAMLFEKQPAPQHAAAAAPVTAQPAPVRANVYAPATTSRLTLDDDWLAALPPHARQAFEQMEAEMGAMRDHGFADVWAQGLHAGQHHLSATVVRNGQVLTISQANDGAITVSGPNGVTTYASPQALADADPHAFAVYQEMFETTVPVAPHTAVLTLGSSLPPSGVAPLTGSSTQSITSSSSVTINGVQSHNSQLTCHVGPDGRVQVQEQIDGALQVHSFDSMQQLQLQDPALYDRLEEMTPVWP